MIGELNDKIQRDIRIGKAIKSKRETLRLFQKDLADIMRVSRTTISEWETGKGIADRHIDKIEKFLLFDPCKMVYENRECEHLRRESVMKLVNEIALGMELLCELLLELSKMVTFDGNVRAS